MAHLVYSECCGAGPAYGTELVESNEYSEGFCGKCKEWARFLTDEESETLYDNEEHDA